MKKIIITCDKCKKELHNRKSIEVGSTGGQDLKITNNLPGVNLKSLSRYHDLHFCSKECLVNLLFRVEP